MMGWAGRAAVVAILGFIILPAIVVAHCGLQRQGAAARFRRSNGRLRWFYKAMSYRDFQTGFHNGLIVTLWSSCIALVVGAAFAFVLDRYEFTASALIEGAAAGAAGGAAFHRRSRPPDPRRADRHDARLHARDLSAM